MSSQSSSSAFPDAVGGGAEAEVGPDDDMGFGDDSVLVEFGAGDFGYAATLAASLGHRLVASTNLSREQTMR